MKRNSRIRAELNLQSQLRADRLRLQEERTQLYKRLSIINANIALLEKYDKSAIKKQPRNKLASKPKAA